ncbi:membrane-associated protein, putative [Bodo saltans]|uniref:Membrane-associated protein, putative n=1 Tax=Bodo saltans TaxID=75058 RepID=A0A0S4JF61_BODSA|nr:membrane-associated protein, putative [Bodo saltans]|eukprot:CUG88918.1 membrane-associated protein, putative [Bodo saltans]
MTTLRSWKVAVLAAACQRRGGTSADRKKKLFIMCLLPAVASILLLLATIGPSSLPEVVSVSNKMRQYEQHQPSTEASDHNIIERDAEAAAQASFQRQEDPKWISMFQRRFVSMPDATLFINDVGLRRLITSASGIVVSSNASTSSTDARRRSSSSSSSSSPLYSTPSHCQNVSVASFLVASKTLEATAEVCFLDRLYSPPRYKKKVEASHLNSNNDTLEDSSSFLRFVLPFVKLRLSTTRGATNLRRSISDDADVQSWLESTVGPLEFSIVTDMKITSQAAQTGGVPVKSQPTLFFRTASGFSVHNQLSSQYLLFTPIAVGDENSTGESPQPSSSLSKSSWWASDPTLYQRLISGGALMELSFNIKMQRESFWAVNEAHHRVGGRTNMYVLDKGLSVTIPSELWSLWLHGNGGEYNSLPMPPVQLSGLREGVAHGAFVGWWTQSIIPHTSQQRRHHHLAGLKGYPLVFGRTTNNDDHDDDGAAAKLVSPSAAPSSRWMITGDSQSRSMYRALRNEMTRRQQQLPQVPQGINSSDGDGGGKLRVADSTFSTASVSYRWDNYLDNLTTTLSEAVRWPDDTTTTTTKKDLKPAPQLVVAAVGMGSHPASWGQYTFLQYQQAAQRVALELFTFACSPRRSDRRQRQQKRIVVWYGAPAWPKPKSVDKFRITNSRLGLFNYAALSALHALKIDKKENISAAQKTRGDDDRLCSSWHHLDFYAMTLPVLKWSKDGAHFDKSMVLEMVTRELLRAAGG